MDPSWPRFVTVFCLFFVGVKWQLRQTFQLPAVGGPCRSISTHGHHQQWLILVTSAKEEKQKTTNKQK